MHIAEEKLKNILLESGVIDEKTFNTVREEASRFNQSVPDVLVGGGYITEDYLVELLEPYFDAPVVNLKSVVIPKETLELSGESYSKTKNVVIFEYYKKRGVVKAAMTDPFDYDVIEFLRAKTGAWVEPYLTTRSGLKYGLKQYKQKLGEDFNQIISENVKSFLSAGEEVDLSKMAEAVPIITILNNIIDHSVSLNASDIHFEPLSTGLLVRARVDGLLHEIITLNKMLESILVARVKILANLQIDEHRTPQDGRFRFEIDDGGTIDVRVNIIPVMHGEKVEMRLLKNASRPLTLEELGLPKQSVEIIMEEIKKPHGMIMVTGPTGHGKTTT
ncbi:MAG: ATPase, T2SS/T4P/T4SS family, partial [Patescibacteria group bacterium]